MGQHQIRYSIILPIRNGGEYVKDCVRSILSQTLPDFNLLVLDNCSTDNTLGWLQSIGDKRIIIYPATSPLSIEENWGRIVTIPRNEYITMLGHDDILKPDFLENINRMIVKHPDASLWHTHFNFIDSSGREIRKCKPMQEKISGTELIQLFLTHSIEMIGTGYLIRSSDYDAVGGFQPYPGLLFADFELWMSLASKSFMAVADAECFSFRLHQSATSVSKDKLMQSAFERFVNFLGNKRAENTDMDKVITGNAVTFLERYTTSYAHRLLRTPLGSREGMMVKDLIGKSQEYAMTLGVQQRYHPEKIFSLRIANFIDQSAFLRLLFLGFKKIWKKPVLH